MFNSEENTARDKLIESHCLYAERVVRSLIRRLSLPSEGFEDFLSAGLLGLVEAAERYEPSSNVPFTNFAFLRIRGAVIDSIRRNSRLTGKRYHAAKALQASYDLHEEYEQIKSTLSKSDRLALLLELGAQTFISAALAQEGTEDDPEEKNPEEKLIAREVRSEVRDLVIRLPEKERFIVEEYYFKGKSFRQIAEENMGLSKSWISRLHSRALSSLKQLVELQKLEAS